MTRRTSKTSQETCRTTCCCAINGVILLANVCYCCFGEPKSKANRSWRCIFITVPVVSVLIVVRERQLSHPPKSPIVPPLRDNIPVAPRLCVASAFCTALTTTPNKPVRTATVVAYLIAGFPSYASTSGDFEDDGAASSTSDIVDREL